MAYTWRAYIGGGGGGAGVIFGLAYSLSIRLSKVRGSWFLEVTDFCHPQARQIHRCSFAPVTSVNAHYYSVLTTPFDMVNAHYVIIDFRAKFFIKIQNQASDTSRSLPSFSSAPFLLRAVPSERLGQVYLSISKCGGLKHKGLYIGGGGRGFNSEVYSVTKKQQRDSFMRRYDYGLISQWLLL